MFAMDLLIDFIKFTSLHCQPPISNIRPAVGNPADAFPAPVRAPVASMMPDIAGEIERPLPNNYSITGHRRDADVETLFQLRIEGKDGRQAWVPESIIQKNSELALFAYWDSVADGRLGAMAHKDLWHPFRIEGHRKTHRGSQLLVYWVGSPERSWQYERVIRKAGPKLVEDYWVTIRQHQKQDQNILCARKSARRRQRNRKMCQNHARSNRITKKYAYSRQSRQLTQGG
ncbi:hypothetical protein BDP55DRAFT_331470 [Colletotrichum godetiae]|uniref:Chromo domain-containing protein n=1 Tax=Colletotrichum godetiae TaxID=1209918 RepID=A0AAJ0ENF5_9PEZI|nr:uncharacterized protein BDP55DRAFT_331215 [Colletotrichum godetiae]XP_060424553.1 uncharacterized protein BDP55DRAFT_331470 [Colletotrichum godetiae]KAK1659760.1 hypothetical protein BDP55DRAFT_331215 [Colletotrichum godetiae]KAK1659789.1 hypothetical protein BDP55DRAFT_331470 [Colletotrichum godetiae]